LNRPRLTLLTDADKRALHEAVLRILSDIGMVVEHDRGLELLDAAGCSIDGTRVHIPNDVVMAAIASAPANVVVCDRDGAPAMDLGGERTYFGTGSDLIYRLDAETFERRQSVLDDVRDTARLVDALPNIDFVMSLAHPSDVASEHGYAESFRAMVEGTKKPIVFTADRLDDLTEMVDIATAVRGGAEELRAAPYVIQYAEPISPLFHPRSSVDKVILCAERGVPLVYSPAPMAGATAPITMAGHVAQGLAECLTGLVIHQRACAGAPFIFGMGPAVLDMATAQSSYNAPEYYLSYVAVIEMIRSYDRPSWGYAGTSDSQVPDGQATLEAAMITFLSSLLGANLNHDIGYLDFGCTGSLEMVAILDELVGQLRRFGRGVPVDETSLAFDVIAEVGPQGHFLEHEHTLVNFRDTQWRPRLLSRLGRDDWAAAGNPTLLERARVRVRELLTSHEPESLPADTARAIAALVAKRR